MLNDAGLLAVPQCDADNRKLKCGVQGAQLPEAVGRREIFVHKISVTSLMSVIEELASSLLASHADHSFAAWPCTLFEVSPCLWTSPSNPNTFASCALSSQLDFNMRSKTVSSILAVLALAAASPAPYTIQTTSSTIQTITASGLSVPTPSVEDSLFAAADDDATTIITLDSAKTVLISVPGNEPYTAIPEQGYVQVQVAVHMYVVVDYLDPSSTVSTVTQTQTIERRIDFCTTTSTIGIS